jgi:hypothetical protein
LPPDLKTEKKYCGIKEEEKKKEKNRDKKVMENGKEKESNIPLKSV